jgi:hypothetical protein
MAAHRKLWVIVGIFPLLLLLAACVPGFDAAQSHQVHPTPSTIIQISTTPSLMC